jgi:competence protein ComEA
LAYLVLDGQKIYIPNINETDINIIQENSNQIVTDGEEYNIGGKSLVININKATSIELETLPGIGPSTALKIIDYRNSNGKFKKIEDIKNVPGIGDAKFESMKEYICI